MSTVRAAFMAKQRRPAPKSTKAPHSRPPRRAPAEAAAPLRRAPPRRSRRRSTAAPLHLRRSGGPLRTRPRGAAAARLQQAADLLESVLRQYPEETELHERVRLYLNICQRQATPREARRRRSTSGSTPRRSPSTAASYDQAIAHLRLVRDEDPDNDHALYMLAVAHAQRGEHAEAVAHLERAIALNPENRALARTRSGSRAAARRRGVPRGARSAVRRRRAPARPLKTRSAR